MRHPVFASELKAGDYVDRHGLGWFVIESVSRNKYTSFKNITIRFTNGEIVVYSGSDRIDAVRMQ